MNKNVKEKQYYIDEMTSIGGDISTKSKILMFVLPFIVGFIIALIYYGINIDKFEYEINSYSEYKLERIEDICDIFITEGFRFDLSYIPEDVSEYNVEYNGDNIKLHYSLKHDLEYAPSLYMDITLSKDLKVLEKSKSYSSKEEYISITKSSINIFVFCVIGLFVVPLCTVFSYIPAMLIGMLISYIHKRIDLSKESKRETEG